MIVSSRAIVLSNLHQRFVHTSAALQLKKRFIFAPIETHEFHKVIKYVRPEKLRAWDPRRSCDLRPMEQIDPNWLKYEYRPFADILDKLPEDHRKLFTVAFGPRSNGTKILLQDALAKTRRHKYDESSLEFKVTWMTWKIRNIQDTLKDEKMRRIGSLKHNVKELIEKRKKYLNRMRYADYKRFEWIIEVLGILFKPWSRNARVERKASINVIVAMHCNELREKKLEEYKSELEKEKAPFLKMKLETLQTIRLDEESVGLQSSVDDEIHATRKLILELEKVEKSHLTIHPTEVHLADESEGAEVKS